MNPKHTKLIERMNEIIKLSDKVYNTRKENQFGEWIGDKVLLNELLIKSKSIARITFGENDVHYKEICKAIDSEISTPSQLQSLKGLLVGALDDFENGFIVGQEFIIAGEIFDSVLEEGKHLLETNHKDAAAVLGRVVIEDALKRIARREEIDDTFRASKLNDELKKASVYSQPQWRLIQAWLDIGNSAAHGNFDNYSNDDVKNMYVGIEQFLATNF